MSTLISPSKTLGYSDIYLDFIAGADSAKKLYKSNDINKVAAELDRRNFNRDKLAEILTRQNKSFGASDKTLANIEKLQKPNALTVFSGQQAVLFGGPMLIIIKALSLVKTADDYSKTLNRPVIPIFWIAGDDHDFVEINHTTVLNRQTEEVPVSYDSTPPFEMPVSELKFDNADVLETAKSKYKEALGESEFTAKLFKLLDSSYQSGESIVTAFGKFISGLVSDYGLVLFSPGDSEVKQLAKEFFSEIIEQQNKLHQLTNRTNENIVAQGYHLQVEKADNATHLMYNLDGRKPLQSDGDKFKAGSTTFTKEQILNKISKEPEKFSPDVLTRPVFQSWLFPVLSQRGGPAEIAYLAQSAPIFEIFNLTVPVYQSRPTATFVEKHFEKMMTDYAINFVDLTGDIEQVINRVLSKSFPEDIEKEMNNTRSKISDELNALKEKALGFDSGLKDFTEQTFGKIDFLLKNFEGKLFSSHKKKSQETRSRIYRLWHALYTGRALQERTLNIGYFISKYGFEFVQFMYDRIDINEKSHQLISLSEYQPK